VLSIPLWENYWDGSGSRTFKLSRPDAKGTSYDKYDVPFFFTVNWIYWQSSCETHFDYVPRAGPISSTGGGKALAMVIAVEFKWLEGHRQCRSDYNAKNETEARGLQRGAGKRFITRRVDPG
jgi:hypothetical protein